MVFIWAEQLYVDRAFTKADFPSSRKPYRAEPWAHTTERDSRATRPRARVPTESPTRTSLGPTCHPPFPIPRSCHGDRHRPHHLVTPRRARPSLCHVGPTRTTLFIPTRESVRVHFDSTRIPLAADADSPSIRRRRCRRFAPRVSSPAAAV